MIGVVFALAVGAGVYLATRNASPPTGATVGYLTQTASILRNEPSRRISETEGRASAEATYGQVATEIERWVAARPAHEVARANRELGALVAEWGTELFEGVATIFLAIHAARSGNAALLRKLKRDALLPMFGADSTLVRWVTMALEGRDP